MAVGGGGNSHHHHGLLGLPAGSPGHFLLQTAAIFGCYLVYGYLQEWIFTDARLREYGWFLTFLQFAFYSLFAGFDLTVFKSAPLSHYTIPLRTYAGLAFLTVATMGLSNTSLQYLNYPTQVIFKSCKLIPVMIGGIFIQGKKYKLLDYASMLCLSGGLVWFTLADNAVSPNFHLTGIVLISLALSSDAVIGNVQEKFMKKYGASNSEVVFFSYLIGLLYILLVVAYEGKVAAALTQLTLDPANLMAKVAAFSFAGYVGVKLVLDMVCCYGALVAVTVTTLRKALTICISFLAFTKPFTYQYVIAGAIILSGIFLNVYSKNSALVKMQLSSCVVSTAALCCKTSSAAKDDSREVHLV